MPEKFTQAVVDKALRTDFDRKEHVIKDSDTKGLTLRIYPNGKSAWSLRYRASGKQRRMKLGEAGPQGMSLRQARERARKLNYQVWGHRDPVEELKAEQRRGLTLGALVDLYLENCEDVQKLKPSTLIAYGRSLRLPELRALYDRSAEGLTHGDVNELIQKVRDTLGKHTGKRRFQTAKNLKTYLHTMYDWALDFDKVSQSPFYTGRVRSVVRGLSKLERPAKRARTPSQEELRQILNALPNQIQPYADIIAVLILSGLRKSEVANAKVGDGPDYDRFDFGRREWVIPARRMKGNVEHRVPLTDALVRIVQPLVLNLPPGGGYVFATSRRTLFTSWGSAKEKLDRDSGVTDWTHHDFRRSVASLMPQELSVPVPVARAILAHATSGAGAVAVNTDRDRNDPTLGRYLTATFFDDRRKAMNAWADWLGFDSDPGGNVFRPRFSSMG